MTTLALVDPALTRATSTAGEDVIEDLKDKCGLVLGGIDWVIEKVSGWSLLGAMFEKVGGDFSDVDAKSQNWAIMSRALHDIADNYDAISAAVPEVWTGKDASSAVRALAEYAGRHRVGAEGAALIATALQDMMVAVKAVMEFLAELCSLLDEAVLKILASPIGIAAEILKGGKTIRKIVGLVDKAMDTLRTLKDVIPPLLQALALLSALMKWFRMAFQLGNFAANEASGSKVDDIAGAAW